MSTAPVYRVRGPVVAQDGRSVWQVVRPHDYAGGYAVLREALSPETAQAYADELNVVLGEIEQRIKVF